MEDIKNLINEIAKLQNDRDTKQESIAQKQTVINELKKEVADVAKVIDSKRSELLALMKDNNIKFYLEQDTNFVASLTSTSEFNYGDEATLLNKLKEDNLTDYINKKVIESIDKNALKKTLKINEELKQSLSSYIGERVSEFVTVQTKENYQLAIQHIEENKKK